MRHKLVIVFVQVLALLAPALPISGHRSTALSTNQSQNAGAASATSAQTETPPFSRSALNSACFEENLGQHDAGAQYVARAGGAAAFLTGPSAVFALPVADEKGRRPAPQSKLQRKADLPDAEIPARSYQPIRLDFVGATPSVQLSGEAPLGGVYNYLIGADPSKWATGVRRFARLRGKEIYPGIDIVYYFSEGEMEYDFVVRPNADPAQIQLDFAGTDAVTVKPSGEVEVQKGKCKLTQRAPVVYQVGESGERVETSSRYQRDDQGRIHLELGAYDRGQELVIDPRVVMGTFLGGAGWDWGKSLALGTDGSIFVTGYTYSANFPTQNPYQPFNYNVDAFVTRLTADGTALIYSTFIGGGGGDVAFDIAVDASNAAYITGTTQGGYPTTPTAPQPLFNAGSGRDMFVTKFDPSGASLAYSTYIGGSTVDILAGSLPDSVGTSIALTADGSAVAVGYTSSTDFPTTPGAFQTHQLGVDGTVTKINPQGTAFTFSTYLGAGGNPSQEGTSDWAYGVATHSDGSIYIAGATGSPHFPTTPGAFQGGLTAFVTRMNSTGTGLIYSALIGPADARCIAVDGAGVAYVAGDILQAGFPTTPSAFQPVFPGYAGSNGFVAKVATDGSSLLYATYLGGGDHNEQIRDIAVRSDGDFAVTGYTLSNDFPLLNSCMTRSTYADAFVTQFQPNGSLRYSVLVGGGGDEDAYGLAFDQAGRAVVFGISNSADLPTTPGAFQPIYTGTNPWPYDNFIAILGPGSCTCPFEFSAANYTVPENVAGGKVTITVNRTGGCGDPVTVDYTTLANTATAGSDYTTKTGTLSFASGEMSKTFDVTILNDTVDETTESFLLQLSNPGAGHLLGQMRTAVVTIEDDDVAGAFEFDHAVYTAGENGGALTITVNRVGGSAGAVSVKYSTGNATATSGADYTAISNATLNFAHGQSSKTFTVTILNDALVEGAEQFNLTLATPSGRATLGKQSKAVVYVVDDELP